MSDIANKVFIDKWKALSVTANVDLLGSPEIAASTFASGSCPDISYRVLMQPFKSRSSHRPSILLLVAHSLRCPIHIYPHHLA